MSPNKLHPSADISVFTNPRYVEGSAENAKVLQSFVEGLNELKIENPEIISATLFGSRLKGEAKKDSDVDSQIFLNADNLLSKGVDLNVDDDGMLDWGKDVELRSAYKMYFADTLAQKTGLPLEVIRAGIYVVPISESIVIRQAKSLAYFHEVAIERSAYYDLPFDEMTTDAYEKLPAIPELKSHHLSYLFGVEMMSGLEKYRKAVIETLEEAGEAGEKAWESIILGIFGEGHIDYDNADVFSQAYPLTLAEARQRYCLAV